MKKKYLLVLIVLVVAAIAAGLFFGLSRSEEVTEEDLINYEEVDEEYVGLAGSVSVIYEVLAGEIEVGYEIDQGLLELRDLKVDITLLNKSQRTIKQVEVALRLLGSSGNVVFENYIVFFNIEPGQKKKGSFSIIKLKRLDEEVASVVISPWKVWGEDPQETSVPSPDADTIEPIIAEEGSPGAVVKSFYEAWINGEYDKLKDYLSSADLQKLSEVEDGYQQWVEALKQNPILGAEILNEVILEDGRVQVDVLIYAMDGSDKTTAEISGFLVKEEGVWKMVLFSE